MTDFERPPHDPTADTSVQRVDGAATVAETDTSSIATDPASVAGAPVDTRPRRTRWLIAGLVVALVVGIAAVAMLSLTGPSPNATVLGYVPADSVAYGEVRLDLPGDQGPELAEFLSHFPGFADQAALETKLDELLDRLVSESTDGAQTYTADIEPWFEGEIAFSMGPLPAAMASDPEAAAADARALLLISVTDASLARTWFEEAFAEAGVSGEVQDYNGTSLTVYSDPDMAGVQAAFGIIDGKVAVVGDLTSVKAAVDSRGASGFTDSEGFAAALGADEGDHLGFMYMDLGAVMTAALAGAGELEVPLSDEVVALVPDWIGFRLRVEGDALVMDSAGTHVEAMPGPASNRASGVADVAPPSTIVLAAGNDYGETIDEVVALVANEPTMQEGVAQLEQALGVIGGLEAAISWMGDTGLVIAQAGDTVEGGLVSRPTDAGDAEQFLTTIRSLVALAGGQAGIEVREEDHAGTTITIIDLGSAESLLGLVGMMGGVPLDPGSTGALPEGDIELSYAVTTDVVVIGSGPSFVKSVLDAQAGESLGDTARYRDLVAQVGAEHTGVTFLDIAAIRAMAEGLITEAAAEERAEYEESIKPFLEPLDAFIAVTVVGADADQQHARLTVK